MSYRNVFISSPANISIKNEQLLLEYGVKRSIPLEDINTIVIDNPQIKLSASTIARLSENGISVIISNNKHLPCTVLLGINNHSRHLQMLKAQIDATKPYYKQLWKNIVTAKISNQAQVLKITGCDKWQEVDKLTLRVKSGDTDNIEALAANVYFRCLFGNDFSRESENTINANLNYGYAVIRSSIAKQLSAYGFEPALGIFHHSQLNNFNLADDLIEPFRPVVDLYTAQNTDYDDDPFGTNEKASLLNLLNADVLVDNKNYSVAYAIELTVKSLTTAVKSNQTEILLPKIIPLKMHEYE